MPLSTAFISTFTPPLHPTRPQFNTCSRPTRHASLPPRPSATLSEDFLTGPSTPPYPRPLSRVVLFSSATLLLWYGYYKFCIEEELRAYLNAGPGGYLALGPFTAGILSPLFLPPSQSQFGVAFGLLWIVAVQYSLYKRINSVCDERGFGKPLVPEWVVLPGFNLIVGLRSIHFLSKAWGGEQDPLVAIFPFLGVQQLGVWQMITTPSLWLALGKRED